MEQLINCTHISVDCVENDPMNLEFGGDAYLGFDMYVETKHINEMETFIRTTLHELEVPLAGLRILETIDLPKDKIWTKERIVEEVKNDAAYLISAEEQAQSLRYLP